VPRFKAGDILIVDWRDGALPKEANKLRPAIVVEDETLFDLHYPNILVVPLTSDSRLFVFGLTLTIDPEPENGCETQCYALAPSVTSISAARVRETRSRIRPDQLSELRRRIAETVGLG
jgi:mRNA interferase MazF